MDCAARLPGKQATTYLKYNTRRTQEKTTPPDAHSQIFPGENPVHIGDTFVTSARHTTSRQNDQTVRVASQICVGEERPFEEDSSDREKSRAFYQSGIDPKKMKLFPPFLDLTYILATQGKS